MRDNLALNSYLSYKETEERRQEVLFSQHHLAAGGRTGPGALDADKMLASLFSPNMVSKSGECSFNANIYLSCGICPALLSNFNFYRHDSPLISHGPFSYPSNILIP